MEYSICIRTLGRAGGKFEKLISSIKQLNIQPKEVVIVIPKGFDLPNVDIENKRVVNSEKGMLLQRIVGYESVKTEYVLLLDDDIEFEKNLVDELIEPLKRGLCDISFPIYEGLLLTKGFRRVLSASSLASIPSKKKNNVFVRFIPSGGFIYNSNLEKSKKYLYSESAPGMCVFGKTKKLLEIQLRDELWIDNVGYPLREDAVLIYKAILKENKVMGVQGIKIEHLDAGGSESNRNLKATYANSYNHILFWKRFIYGYEKSIYKKLICSLAIVYWALITFIHFVVKLVTKRDYQMFKEGVKGIVEGFSFILTNGEIEGWTK